MFIKKELINKIVITVFLGCLTVPVLASEAYGIGDLVPDSQAKVTFHKAFLKASVNFLIQTKRGEIYYPVCACYKMKLKRINPEGRCTPVWGTLFYKKFGSLPEDRELYGFTEGEYKVGVVYKTWDIIESQ